MSNPDPKLVKEIGRLLVDPECIAFYSQTIAIDSYDKVLERFNKQCMKEKGRPFLDMLAEAYDFIRH